MENNNSKFEDETSQFQFQSAIIVENVIKLLSLLIQSLSFNGEIWHIILICYFLSFHY